MKCQVIPAPKGIDSLTLSERSDPTPGPRQVLVRVRATSLNYRDLLTIEGKSARAAPKPDLVPLSDGAGEIVEAGDRMLWVTDLGWVMGPWQILGPLGLGASMVLFEGVPDHPAPDRLWAMVARHRVTHLGIAPTVAGVAEIRRPGLIFRPLPPGLPPVQTVLVWRRDDDSPVLRHLREFF